MGKIISIVAPTRSGKSFLTERLAEHFTSPAVYEYEIDANALPQEIQDALEVGGSIEGWLYFRNRHVRMQVEAMELAKTNEFVFLDTSWITDQAYVSFAKVNTFQQELLTAIHTIDTKTLIWPDIVIMLSCDDAKSEELWRASGKEFERKDSYFSERLLPLKREFEKTLHELETKCHVISIDRTNLDFSKPDDLRVVTEKIKEVA